MSRLTYTLDKSEFEFIENLTQVSRAFLYGDGCFETILVYNRTPVFWEEHMRRLESTLEYLEIAPIDSHRLKASVGHLLTSQSIGDISRLRLTAYRSGEGRYLPSSNEAELMLDVETFDRSPFNKGKSKHFAKARQSHQTIFHDRFKLIDRHRQVLYAKEAKNRGTDDLVICNEAGAVVSGINGNIYAFMDDKCYTPPLEAGCLDGTVRKILLRNGLVEEHMIAYEEAKDQARFCSSNSIEGIRMFGEQNEYEGIESLRKSLDELMLNSVRDFQETLP